MTNRLQKLLLASCLALGLGLTTQVSAEELRIGFIAPLTGIFAQIGKDMAEWFRALSRRARRTSSAAWT